MLSTFISFLFLFVTLFLSSVQANPIQALFQCTAYKIPLVTPGKPLFKDLQSRSFRNDFTTPYVISKVSSELQVAQLIKCAKQVGLRVCARSGGHSLIGHNQCKGLLIDLADLRKVAIQPGNIAYIEPGATLGEVLVNLHKYGRWLAAGVCPNVGFAGYTLGGGHGPYEGTLGLTCDSFVSLRMVDRYGNILTVSKKERPFLFWGLCGGGGGQFGIVTAFRINTAASKIYDNGVVFRFNWPAHRGGEVLEKWQYYNEFGGKVWFRMELNKADSEEGVFGYGACYDVSGVQECLSRLQKAPFFNVPERTTAYLSAVNNALDLHAFFGPAGDWGRKRASNVQAGMLQARGTEYGAANGRIYQSTFLKMSPKPDKQFWQKYVNFCQNPVGTTTIPWIVCEMNLFNNAIDWNGGNSFPYRHANLITHYIVGGGSENDKKYVYYWMKNHFAPYTIGVYVNYPELELGKTYPKAYWGGNLPYFKQLKKLYDPEFLFMNPQPIPTA